MSPATSYLTIGEFNRSIEMLRVTIEGRCNRMDTELNEQTRDIADIKAELKLTSHDDKMSTRKNASGWSAGVAGVIIGAVELIKALSN